MRNYISNLVALLHHIMRFQGSVLVTSWKQSHELRRRRGMRLLAFGIVVARHRFRIWPGLMSASSYG